MGRPRSGKALKDTLVGFRITEEGAKWLDEVRGDMSRSEYMRRLLAAAAAGKVKADVRP